MEKTIEIATLNDTNKKVNKIPFWLLITINILIVAGFFALMMIKIHDIEDYVKDSIVSTEFLRLQLEANGVIKKEILPTNY
jgi:hypothetical protein